MAVYPEMFVHCDVLLSFAPGCPNDYPANLTHALSHPIHVALPYIADLAGALPYLAGALHHLTVAQLHTSILYLFTSIVYT